MTDSFDTPPGYLRQPKAGEVTLFTLALQYEQMRGSLARLADRMESKEQLREERDEALRESVKVAVQDAVRDALAPLSARVDGLEKKQAKVVYTTGGVTMAAGALAWLWDHFGKLVPLLFVVLLGCAQDAPSGEIHWPETLRPVTVLIPEDMPADCRVAAEEAVLFWETDGQVTYLEPYAALQSRAAGLGEISFRFDPDIEAKQGGGTVGFAHVQYRKRSGEILRADSSLLWCDEQTSRHELGHALGLEHVNDPENIMFPYAGPGDDVTFEQIEQVE